MGDDCYSTQLIDGDGAFNVSGLEKFSKGVKLGECGLSYAVVSIMGPQSSGKSTLLNHLFGTNFREMDAFRGRSQTTKGIWMAKCGGIEPCTLVMDLEGTDGRERGEMSHGQGTHAVVHYPMQSQYPTGGANKWPQKFWTRESIGCGSSKKRQKAEVEYARDGCQRRFSASSSGPPGSQQSKID